MLTTNSERFAVEIRKPGSNSPALVGEMGVTRAQFCGRALRLLRAEMWYVPPQMLRRALGQVGRKPNS